MFDGWIYLAVSGTGGKVLGRFKAGGIWSLNAGVGEYKSLIDSHSVDGKITAVMGIEDLWPQGYINQKYAIEITDFEQCDYELTDFFKPDTDYETIKKTPQCFQYAYRCIGVWQNGNCDFEYCILMPIHQKWFDMIASGEKKYEFRNVLPKALRG